MDDVNAIHPSAVIGPEVVFGRDNIVSPYAVILGPCRIGDRNWIGPHTSIGTPAQIRGGAHVAGWTTPETSAGVVIGDDNVIREFATVHQPTEAITRIGSNCFLMAYAHVPHDADIADDVTLSNATQIGGHTVIGTGANLGLGTMVHQRLAIGGGAMVGMGSVVTKDVPPFAIVYGAPARIAGANKVGLERAGYDTATIDALTRHYLDGGSGELPSNLPAELLAIFAAHEIAVGRRQ
jgi:UDP-N-acetylglucosamine acyltransferase